MSSSTGASFLCGGSWQELVGNAHLPGSVEEDKAPGPSVAIELRLFEKDGFPERKLTMLSGRGGPKYSEGSSGAQPLEDGREAGQ